MTRKSANDIPGLARRAGPRMWGRLPACRFTGRPRPMFRAIGYRPDWQTRCLRYIFRQVLILALCASNLAIVSAADLGETVVVVYNRRMPESKSLAEYYSRRRQVPADQLFGFDLPETETISRRVFREQLQQPLLKL